MAESMTKAENRYFNILMMCNKIKSYGLPEPKVEDRRNEFIITFYNNGEMSNVAIAEEIS